MIFLFINVFPFVLEIGCIKKALQEGGLEFKKSKKGLVH